MKKDTNLLIVNSEEQIDNNKAPLSPSFYDDYSKTNNPKDKDINIILNNTYFQQTSIRTNKILSSLDKDYINSCLNEIEDPLSVIFAEFLQVSVPFIFMNLCWTFSTLVDIHYCKYFSNASYETSFGLANVVMNVTGFNVGELISGSETLISQSYGQKNYTRMVLIVLNALLIMLYIMPFIWLLWFFSESWAMLLFDDAEVAGNVQLFLRYAMPTLIAFFVMRSIGAFQMSAQIYLPLMAMSIEIIITYPWYTWYIVFTKNYLFEGLAICWTIAFILQTVILIVTSMFIQKFKDIFIISWDILKQSHEIQYFQDNLRYGVPALVLAILNFMAMSKSQIIVIWTVKPKYPDNTEYDEVFNAHLNIQNIVGALFVIGTAIQGSITYPIGNKLGEGHYLAARKFGKFCIITCVCIGLFMSTLLMCFRDYFVSLYSEQALTVDVMLDCTLWVSLNVVVFYLYCAQVGCFYGFGYQKMVLVVSLICNYGVGVPTDFLFSYYYGIPGVWMSFLICSVLKTCVLCYMYFLVDWKQESIVAIFLNKKKEEDLESLLTSNEYKDKMDNLDKKNLVTSLRADDIQDKDSGPDISDVDVDVDKVNNYKYKDLPYNEVTDINQSKKDNNNNL